MNERMPEAAFFRSQAVTKASEATTILESEEELEPSDKVFEIADKTKPLKREVVLTEEMKATQHLLQVARKKYLTLATTLEETAEVFPLFTLPEKKEGVEGEEVKVDIEEEEAEEARFKEFIQKLTSELDEHPNHSELITRFAQEGIRAVLGPGNNVFLIPAKSEDIDEAIEEYSIFPRQLPFDAAANPQLKELRMLDKVLFQKGAAQKI